eukprot:Stramenopile-MAST_4_protein_1340
MLMNKVYTCHAIFATALIATCVRADDPWCCTGGVAPESNCTGLDQHDCEFHLPQCAWGPSKKCPSSFPTSFSLVAAPDGHFTEAHMDGNTKTFAMRKVGGSQDVHAFEAIFCNTTGLYTFSSAQVGNCYYQHSKTCDDLSFRNAVAFLAQARDDTLTLLVNGINPKSVPFSSSGGNIVWSERTPACSDEAFLYVNVTLSADNALLAWSRGSAVINQLNNTCTVTNTGRTFTKFVSSSNITSKMVETFVNGRIAVEGLDCLSGGDF